MEASRIGKNARMSQIVIHGGTIYLAGQVPDDISADIRAQTRSVLGKIDALLAEAGASRSSLLAATVYLTDMTNFAAMNEVWDAWVDQSNPPARATVGAALARPEYLIEIAATAAKYSRGLP